MHTKHHGPVAIHYNSDLSGEAIIVADWGNGPEIRVPCALLLELVAEFVAGERISKLEQATPAEILGLEVSK